MYIKYNSSELLYNIIAKRTYFQWGIERSIRIKNNTPGQRMSNENDLHKLQWWCKAALNPNPQTTNNKYSISVFSYDIVSIFYLVQVLNNIEIKEI